MTRQQEKPKPSSLDDDESPRIANDNDEKSHTFRQRRLTYTKHHLEAAVAEAAAAAADDDDEEPEPTMEEAPPLSKKAHTTTTGKRNREAAEQGSKKKLRTRVLHAGELVRQPLSAYAAVAAAQGGSKSRLYEPPYAFEQSHQNDEPHDQHNQPPWKKRRTFRHSFDDDETLPFPRTIVGTYSCHGVEPVYDSDYEHHDEEAAEDNEPLTSSSSSGTVTAKINQDRGGVAFPYGNCPKTALFAAYDGHGLGGEHVSQFSLHEVQRRLEKHPSFESNLPQAFHDTFLQVDEALVQEPDIEPLFSGTTACVALIREKTISISNAGDSRAVLGRRKELSTADDDESHMQPQLVALDLTVDQNPDSPGEQERIENAGGFVSPPPEEGLSARVWLDSGYSQIGLAMARSIGDHAVTTVGVIAEPVVTTHEITDRDEFMIIATDGVWEFIESQEAVDVVQKHLAAGEGATKACQALIETAAAKWHEEEGDYRDDITALVVRVQDLGAILTSE